MKKYHKDIEMKKNHKDIGMKKYIWILIQK